MIGPLLWKQLETITNFEVDSIVETDTSVSAVFKPVWHFFSNLVVIILISSFLQIFLSYFSFDTHVGHSVSSVQGYFETTCSSSPKDEIRTVLVPCMVSRDLVHKVKEQVHSQ